MRHALIPAFSPWEKEEVLEVAGLFGRFRSCRRAGLVQEQSTHWKDGKKAHDRFTGHSVLIGTLFFRMF